MRKAAVGVVFMALWATGSFAKAAGQEPIRCYSYVSPPAKAVLDRFGITEGELVKFASDGLRSRKIAAIGADQLYPGSADALRVDLRRKADQLLLEVSVRQGGSIHNMLERWSGRRLIPVEGSSSAASARKILRDSISQLLDELKAVSASPEYQAGKMIPEEYVPEKDE